MIKKALIVLFFFGIGFGVSYLGLKYYPGFSIDNIPPIENATSKTQILKKEVIGFLPFWLLNSTKVDYSNYLNNLAVFSLVVADDGTIKKFTKPLEGEPGYFSLVNGKFDKHMEAAKSSGSKLSLVIFSGNDSDINTMMEKPEESAKNLMSEIIPISKKYGFDEINLDIEKVSDASPEARLNFKKFVSAVREETNKNSLSLTIDVVASSFVKTTNLVSPSEIIEFVDRIIIMAYDYHFIGSLVTGPVAPENGAGIVSEFDVNTAIVEALRSIKPEKIILGIPLYGYEWESIGSVPRSAIIPSTGLTISNKRAEEFLRDCNNCKQAFNETDKEMSVVYKDDETGFYHQFFYPEKRSMQSKLDLVENYNLGGIALWALGYEGNTILQPLSEWNH